MRDADVKTWVSNRIKTGQIDKYLDGDRDFIDDNQVFGILEENSDPEPSRVRDIIRKSLEIKTLSAAETAALINVTDRGLLEEMKEAAAEVKRRVYDNRIVTFAPLYTGNYCVNNCLYCGFKSGNSGLVDRRALSMEEIRRESEILAGKIGHKRLIVVYGEHPLTDTGYIAESIRNIYGVKVKTRNGFGQIRRVNVNAAPMSIEDLKMLHDVGIGTYQVFQETYHHGAYRKMHPSDTLKGNYKWRLYSMHRALEAGVDDVGLGVLFGLFDWRFEIIGLVLHAIELETKFGIGPHTVSFPRIEPAMNSPVSDNPQFKVSDDDFRKIITVIRLAIPYTGMIITARESAQMRRATLGMGVTQTDASTRIGIGAYSEAYDRQQEARQQFILGDTRSLDEVIREFSEMGYITSFCTAGYRCGRTGECIMELLRSGQEGRFCKLNAILTFREWLDDFASEETLRAGEKVIEKEIREVKEKLPAFYSQLVSYYERIKKGERDLYF
ncbi:MAG: [FeFe] hydrogenase H-cluster radical SAM maturase HydG [Candidatus Aureabacteria bacterium]|nr:[FeFe] hydrogenase H-cluster radical SAM maturase HydG [Candidatus Auribacterota bacterium]